MANLEIQRHDYNQDALAWYTRLDGSSPSGDVTKEAYDDAVQYLRREFARAPNTIAWIDAQTTKNDVLDEVNKAEQEYRTKRDGQHVLPWLRKVSSAIQVYGHVFDTLAQHHAEYVSLAWGAIKFILMGISNHEKLLEHFSTALEEIAFVLPRAEFIAELYRTDRVKAVLSRLYANVLVFLRQALKWYDRSSAGRAICAVFKPFPLQCEKIMSRIRDCVKTTGQEAAIASQAELRGLRGDVRRHGEHLIEIERKLDQRYLVNGERLDAMDQRILEVQANSLQAVQRLEKDSRILLDVHTDTRDIKCRVTEVQTTVTQTHTRIVQYEDIIQSLAPDILPETTFQTISSIARRAANTRGHTRDKTDLEHRLRDWASSVSRPILVFHTGPRAQNQAREWATKAFAGLQLDKGLQVYWYLRANGPSKSPFNRVEVLKNLTFQLLRSAKEGSALKVDISALEQLKTALSEAEWLYGFGTIAQHHSQCFFVIEADNFTRPAQNQKTTEQEGSSMEFFEKLVEAGRSLGCDIKILVISPCDELASEAAKSDNGRVAEVLWSAPAPPHLKRLVIRPRAERVRGLRSRV